MKNINKTIIALALTAGVFSACKKGADDPMLTIRSRDARLIGDYTVSAVTTTNSETTTQKTAASGSQGAYAETSTKNTSTTFNGSKETENVENKWSTTQSGLPVGAPTSITAKTTTTTSYSISISVVKDGTYTWKMVGKSSPETKSTVQSSSPGQFCGTGISPLPAATSAYLTCDGTYFYSYPASYDQTYEGTAEWNWLDANKSKTELVFENGPLTGSWNVLQLKNKEIKLEKITNDKDSSPDPSGTDQTNSYSTTITLTSSK